MAARGKKGRRRLVKKPIELDALRNDINVTPLVDVVLVLLIIMMVIGPMLARGKDINLPKTTNHIDAGDNHEPIIAVDQYGKIWVDKDEVSEGPNQLVAIQDLIQQQWQELRASNSKLGEGVDRTGEDRVLLKVSPEIPYGDVYPLIMALHDMGAAGIDLGTEELKE